MEVFRAPIQTWKSFLISVATLSAVFLFALFYVLLVPLLLYFYVWSMSFWIFAVCSMSTVWWHHIIHLDQDVQYWRENRVFEAWRSYFGFRVFDDGDSSAGGIPLKKILYTFVPHGLFPFGLALVSGVLFKGKDIKIGIASSLFYIPVFCVFVRLLGCVEADKELFQSGGDIVLVPDGIAGAFHSDRKNECLYLRGRKGFIREAITTQYDIVPVYCFGHTQLYDVYGWQELSRRFGFAFVFFWGRNPTIWLPHARSVSVVLGKKIVLPPEGGQNDTHWQYLKEVKALYDKYREIVPEWDAKKELKIV